jgi:hypothetical protein
MQVTVLLTFPWNSVQQVHLHDRSTEWQYLFSWDCCTILGLFQIYYSQRSSEQFPTPFLVVLDFKHSQYSGTVPSTQILPYCTTRECSIFHKFSHSHNMHYIGTSYRRGILYSCACVPYKRSTSVAFNLKLHDSIAQFRDIPVRVFPLFVSSVLPPAFDLCSLHMQLCHWAIAHVLSRPWAVTPPPLESPSHMNYLLHTSHA